MAGKNAAGSFPLKGFVPPVKGTNHIDDMQIPDPTFDPEGAWSHSYKVYSLAGRGAPWGSLEITRQSADGTVTLGVAYRKRTSGAPLLAMDAKIEARGDILATPLRWEFESYTQLPPRKVMEETRLKKRGRCDANGMRIETNGHQHHLKADGPFTINWPLFDAVQRMPRQTHFETELFTLFDHFDQPKPEQQIRFWESVDLTTPKGKTMRLHCLEQIGRGVLPIYYYLSDAGQLMAVISGVEGYLLAESKEA